MSCMKCGRDLEEGQVFCTECLETMKRYPVKLNTAVILPKHRDNPHGKRNQPRRRQLSPEEQVKRFRKRNRLLFFFNMLLLAATLVLGYFTFRYFTEDTGFRPGQNYSAMETTSSTDPT